MGLRYSFELVTEAGSVDVLLRQLATHLEPEDATRLRAVLPWSPAIDRELVWGSGRPERDRQGIGGLAPSDDVDRPNDVCLTFAFPPDDELRRWAREMDSMQPGPDVTVGCVYTRLHVGRELALLVATACTTEMSRLFEDSASVRATWSGLAQSAGALALFLDTERDHEWQCVWPEPRMVPRVGQDGFWSEDFESLRVDPYCHELLGQARLG